MTREITIGRAGNCDLRLDPRCNYASNQHATILYDGRQLMFKDTSSNGTYINNVKVHNRTVPLHRGDVIMLAGRYPLKWKHIDAFLSNSPVPSTPKTINPAQANTPQSSPVEFVPIAEPQVLQVIPASQKESQKPQTSPVNNTFNSTPRLNKWSWGAFVLSGIWGLFNGCWWILLVNVGLFVLMLITSITFILPILFGLIGLGLSIWFGIKGREWSWKNREWSSVEDFERVQKTWDTVGIVLFILGIVFILLSPILIPLIGLSILSSFLPF